MHRHIHLKIVTKTKRRTHSSYGLHNNSNNYSTIQKIDFCAEIIQVSKRISVKSLFGIISLNLPAKFHFIYE